MLRGSSSRLSVSIKPCKLCDQGRKTHMQEGVEKKGFLAVPLVCKKNYSEVEEREWMQ